MIEIFMALVGISMGLSGVSQVVKMLKEKTNRGVSLTTWIILLNGSFWWLLYGIKIGSTSLIITNALNLSTSIVIIYLYKKLNNKIGNLRFK
jgi:uncharacterized protein with PQ loop repeat